jgi:hypothetical protein
MERQSRAEHDDRPLQDRSAREPEPDASRAGWLAKMRNRDAPEDREDRCSNNWRKMTQQGSDAAERQGQTEAR